MKLPPMQPVADSSNVSATGHVGNSLFISFKRRGETPALYRYDGVTDREHQVMREAESVGVHFHQHIRGRYTGIKIS